MPTLEQGSVVYNLVEIINISPNYGFTDKYDGVLYECKSKSKLIVPEFVAKHWFGDVDLPSDIWGEEVDRVAHRNDALWREIIAGNIIVKTWKLSNKSRSYSVDVSREKPKTQVSSVALDESDMQFLDNEKQPKVSPTSESKIAPL